MESRNTMMAAYAHDARDRAHFSLKFYVERIIFIVFVGCKVDQAIIIIQAMQDLHVTSAQLKVKNVKVFLYAISIGRFRNNDCTILNLKLKRFTINGIR